MSKLYEITVLIVILVATQSAQSQNLKQCLRYAEENAAKGDYYGAITFYQKAMTYDSASIDILYKYALVLKDYNNYPLAAYYFEKVYDKGNGRIHPESIYWLAVMQKNMGDYRESGKSWRKVKRVLGKDRKSYYAEKTKQESLSLRWANTTKRDSTNWEIESIDINTYDAEFSPFVYNDDLYFSSIKAANEGTDNVVNDKDYRIQIYRSGSDGVIGLDTLINSHAGNNGEAVLSPDGTRLYFTRCTTGERCHIYVSRKTGNQWSRPDKLGVINIDGFSSVQPFITGFEDKEVLFFSSDREKGEGGMDIWYSLVTKNGNVYSEPKNCGGLVNTPDDEISPYYDTSNQALYFSSTWHKGYGGMDVFESKGTPGNFGTPNNMGKPINSAANDMYFKLADTKTGYLTSNRIGSKSSPHATCCNDLFKVSYVEEPEDTLPYKTLEDLNKFLPVTLYFHNDRPNPNSMDTLTELNYLSTYETYTRMLPTYKKEYSKGLSGTEAEEAVRDIEDFFYDFVDKGVEDLEVFTQLLLVELEKGQKVELTVQGYASPLAKTEYNVNLTYRRISSMINFLKEYNNGALEPYINGNAENGGQLFFVQVPYGEYTADKHVSDNPNDQKNSVYSRAAALERKIEILSVQTASEKDSSYAEIRFDQESHDFGVLNEETILSHTFKFTNTGSEPLKIEYIEVPCSCIQADYLDQSLAPGETANIRITVPTDKFDGKTVLPLKVETNGFPKTKTLNLTFQVIR